MSNEAGNKPDSDGDKVATDRTDTRTDTEPKEPKETKTVSFNRDVHVKRFGKPRESRGASSENQTRKEPFTHLSEQELIKEANKVLAQAKSVTCTADHPPEKFFSLPHRRKLKEDRSARRNSDDANPEATKTALGRSTSDVSPKKRKERTSLSTLFRRAQRNKSPDAPVVVTTKPVTIVKRSKSDVSDLKSNTKLNTQVKPIRKRSGSETEEFLKSLRNKKSQLSPIIESSPRDDYFKKTPPLEAFQKQKLTQKDSKSEDQNSGSERKVNPIEKPPRYKTPEKQEPKAPTRTKRGKSLEKEKEKSPSINETPKRRTEVKKTLLVDKIDSFKTKDTHPVEVKERIKESIRKIEENIYGDKEMIHSSQLPPDKPPLTRGHTVDHIVKILKEDQSSPAPKTHLISPLNGASNTNQPFSYLKPSVSPDPNLFVRTTSPERVPSPVNKMADKGVVYAAVVRDHGDVAAHRVGKQTVHKTYSPSREKYGNFSDEDEGLGYEERYKHVNNRYGYNNKTNQNENLNSLEGYKITDSPIKPKFREYKLTSFEDFEPTYANEYPSNKDKSHDYIDTFRGRADGMDTKKKHHESEHNKVDLDFNELSHRRQLLESRLNARRTERERINVIEPVTRYLEKDPIYEAEKRRQATEKYVDETARYYRQTLERDGFAESSVTEDFNKYESDIHKVNYKTESRTFQEGPKDETDRRDLEHRFGNNKKVFPPEPEYEPPSLEFTSGKPVLTQDEYKEKKYRVKKNLNSSHDTLQTGQKYKTKDDWFGKRKGHYASNPEIAQEREEDYANIRYEAKHAEAYHNSLRRVKNKDRYKNDFTIRRHGSGDSREYYRDDRSPRRYEIDNRLVDSGIENDFRKDSNGDLHRRHRRHESEDDVNNTSMFLASERRHTEDNYPSEQIYANGEYIAKFKDFRDESYRKDYIPRERSADDGSHFEQKVDRLEKSPNGDKISAKPPKATKKLSGLEKMKQLFSRDSSKKSKKEKEVVQPKNRTRVLKSPEHLAADDSDYKRYTDPEPSEIIVRKVNYECSGDERRIRNSREALDQYRGSDSPERKYKETHLDRRFNRTLNEDRRYKERKEQRRYNSSDRESDHHSRPSDAESDLRKSRSRTAGPLDSPALAERYRERRRLATPSPTPSPPRRPPPPANTTSNWFKSLDRLTARKKEKATKIEKESVMTADEEPRKAWSKTVKPLNSPAKNLRFFGDTDIDSDANVKQPITKTRNNPKSHNTLRKTISNSSTGKDEVDNSVLSSKSYSLSNLREEKNESPRTKQYYKRNLRNISEISNSETESQLDRRGKPPISPYDRSRSHSSSKTLKGSKTDLRRRTEERGSSTELRGSKQELSRDLKHRRRTPANNSGESSTEGDSSHQSQRSVVYLHATTVGDIPDPGRLTRNRSRDDVSSVNSSNLQVRSTTKSFSIFAPWTPRHYNDQHDVHYAQRPRKPKPPAKKTPSKISVEDRPATLQKNKSYSQTTLTRRPQNNRLTSSSQTLYKKSDKRNDINNSTMSRRTSRDAKKSQSSEILNKDSDRDRLSRSISMPKDNSKKAGWFKLSSKKKPEINTRVR